MFAIIMCYALSACIALFFIMMIEEEIGRSKAKKAIEMKRLNSGFYM